MDKEMYQLMEDYMISCMKDSAHDKEHIYRVLYQALRIAGTEQKVDYDILIAACLLHDIGRKEQQENPKLCHAAVGSEKAMAFLMAHGWEKQRAEHVKECILTHRFKKNQSPQSVEARILFDADKLDATGTIGIARTLVYAGMVSDPLYSCLPDGTVSDGENDKTPSFFQEYKYKLEKLYTNFCTEEGRRLAEERQESAISFYESMYKEVKCSYEKGLQELEKHIIGKG